MILLAFHLKIPLSDYNRLKYPSLWDFVFKTEVTPIPIHDLGSTQSTILDLSILGMDV